jgi:hypothetical protein
MLNLGHAHPDFVYPNDELQVKLTFALLLPAAIISCVMVVLAVLSM